MRGAKYTFTGSGFVLDLVILLHRGNLSFFLDALKVTDDAIDHFSSIGCIILNALTPEAAAAAATPKMELFVTIVNSF